MEINGQGSGDSNASVKAGNIGMKKSSKHFKPFGFHSQPCEESYSHVSHIVTFLGLWLSYMRNKKRSMYMTNLVPRDPNATESFVVRGRAELAKTRLMMIAICKVKLRCLKQLSYATKNKDSSILVLDCMWSKLALGGRSRKRCSWWKQREMMVVVMIMKVLMIILDGFLATAKIIR